jgi:hypothetical protein
VWQDYYSSLEQYGNRGNKKDIPFMVYVKVVECPEEEKAQGEKEKEYYFSMDEEEGSKPVSAKKYNSVVYNDQNVCFEINCAYLNKFTVEFKDLYKEYRLH